MKLFNTLSMKKEEFIPLEAGKVRMYACGPTVYDYIHVGNARPTILFDVLRRYFEYRGYEVAFVQNFTDIDDKIIKRAGEEGISSNALAERFMEEYFIDAEGLGVRRATVHPKATENMNEIIHMIEALVEKGYAYPAAGDVYFRTERFQGYGKLSGQPLEELRAGARIDVSESKESPMDFALWKASKEGEPFWPSPWGDGRPGWHIECSAMAGRYLGKTIDIHCGGQDLTFPHHENEIAQSEAGNGCTFSNYWLHNGFLSINNKKMSKSLGNFFTVRDAAAAYGYDTIRMFMLMSHYRSPLSYSGEVLAQAKSGLERLYTAVENLEFLIRSLEAAPEAEEEQTVLEGLKAYRERFIKVMDDDFNTADGIAVIFEMVREINSATAPEKHPSKMLAEKALHALRELTDVLGLLYRKDREKAGNLETEVEALIEARQKARKEKNFAEADRIRDQLKDMGITLEDTPHGVKWKQA